MGFDVAQQAILLGPPFRRPLIEEAPVDPPVQFVEVHRVDPVLEAAVFDLQPQNGLVVKGLLVGVALAQSADDPIQNLLREGDAPKQFAEAGLQHLLPRVGLGALPLVAGAVVVNVLLLLQFSHQGAPAVAAADQVAEGEIPPHQMWFPPIAPVHHVLNLLPHVARNDRFVLPRIRLAVEVEVAAVDAVPQDLVDGGGRHRPLALRVPHAVLLGKLGDLLQGKLTHGVPLEHALDERRKLRIRNDGAFSRSAHDVQVAERSV